MSKNILPVIVEGIEILLNEDDEVLITFPYFGIDFDKKANSFLYYGGGKHAIILKNGNIEIVLVLLPPEVQRILPKAKTVLIAEYAGSEFDVDAIADEYELDVIDLPETDSLAEMYIPIGVKISELL